MTVNATVVNKSPRGGPPPVLPRPPARSVVEALDEQDRASLAKILTEASDFMDHPEFHVRGAEKTLFGAVAKLTGPRTTSFVQPMAVVVPRPSGGSAIPTLTGPQEQLLFKRMNYARMRLARILNTYTTTRMTAQAMRESLAWNRRVLELRAQIVRMNMPLVLAMAKRTRLNSIDFNELISEGNMALLRAVDKFDCGRGFKFSTYSCRAILKSFSRVAMRASRYRGRFPAEFDPALEPDYYIQQKRDEAEEDCVDELKSILVKNLAELSDVEQTVIRERFALVPGGPMLSPPKTLEQVGSIIGVTKERVRQIQNKALRKIRTALEDTYLAA